MLCSPTYVFAGVTWRVTSTVWMCTPGDRLEPPRLPPGARAWMIVSSGLAVSAVDWYQPGADKGASRDTRGGVWALAPPEEANPAGHIFPAGYCALVSSTFTYLTALDGGGRVESAAASLFDHGAPSARLVASKALPAPADPSTAA